jgi:hypothetical protein
MKKVLLTLALVSLSLVFPVLFLMVGSCAAESPVRPVTIKVDPTVVPPAWTVVNPERVDLPDPTHFLVVGKDAARSLALLDQTQTYACLVAYEPASGFVNLFGSFLTVFSVHQCEPLPLSQRVSQELRANGALGLRR